MTDRGKAGLKYILEFNPADNTSGKIRDDEDG